MNKMIKQIISLLVLISLGICAFGQKEYGRKIVDELASDAFYGRGYVNKGEKKAADYIAKEFEKFGAEKIGDSYYQEFTLGVNTFPGDVSVTIGNKTLKTGEDFIVNANSGSANGMYKLKELSINDVEQLLASKDFSVSNGESVAYVVDFPTPKDNTERSQQYYAKQLIASIAPLIVINDNKFTWTVGREEYKYPIIEMKSDFLQGDSVAMISIENKFIPAYKTQNVIGIIPARRRCKRKKYIFFTAHYDHLGMMGTSAIMNGANDNASGTAMMLSLMKYYSEHKPEYSMVFVGFGAEEAGIVGSKYFTENPLVPLDQIKFVINVDLMGTGSEGITVVNATEHPKEFKWLQDVNKDKQLLKKIGKRGKAANSDHYWFEEKGVPAFFIYTLGGVTHYHDIKDRPETLPLTKFNELNELIRAFVKKF